MPYLSASAVTIHYEEALYQVCGPLPLPLAEIVFRIAYRLYRDGFSAYETYSRDGV